MTMSRLLQFILHVLKVNHSLGLFQAHVIAHTDINYSVVCLLVEVFNFFILFLIIVFFLVGGGGGNERITTETEKVCSQCHGRVKEEVTPVRHLEYRV